MGAITDARNRCQPDGGQQNDDDNVDEVQAAGNRHNVMNKNGERNHSGRAHKLFSQNDDDNVGEVQAAVNKNGERNHSGIIFIAPEKRVSTTDARNGCQKRVSTTGVNKMGVNGANGSNGVQWGLTGSALLCDI
jgi:hypothetical protein